MSPEPSLHEDPATVPGRRSHPGWLLAPLALLALLLLAIDAGDKIGLLVILAGAVAVPYATVALLAWKRWRSIRVALPLGLLAAGAGYAGLLAWFLGR